ncbi:hypothetical protein ACFOLC_03975 [Lysobacter cavernae]|uniref:Lipoprotein n=1 Tax=Lysobacter cavernae TaxID=1685901 RepID=A0ABV7RQN1_9GAMM
MSSLAIATLLAACSGDKPSGAANDAGTGALPAPEGARGGVTGMPDQPGPGQIGPPPAALPPQVALDDQGNPILPPDDGTAAATGDTPPAETQGDAPSVTDEPTPQDAVAVVREYYAAINRRDYARAYALWSDGGRASGQSPQQFAGGFVDTAGVSVEIMAPGAVDAGAGSRFIEVPVALTATQGDGSPRKYVGAYTLRRAVVDGASAEQRAWRIGTADIREVKP